MKQASEIDYRKFKKNASQKPKEVILPNESYEKLAQNRDLLEKCRIYYDSLRDFRNRAERNFNFYRGKQWSDKIKDHDTGEWITEEAHLNKQGRPALVQNLVRQVTNNLIGQYRNGTAKSVVISRTPEGQKQSEMMSCAMEAVQMFNLAKELDARNFEEFAISGAPFQKLSYAYLKERNRPDIFIENVDPRRMFFNTDIRDIRYTDLRLIGQIHDLDIETLVSKFAKTPEDEAKIREVYRFVDKDPLNTRLDSQSGNNIDFLIPNEPDKCRLFEIWHIEPRWRLYVHDTSDGTYNIVQGTMQDLARANQARIAKATELGVAEEDVPLMKGQMKKEMSWFVSYMTPDGFILQENETPYLHQEHPFVFLLYPLIRGEVWGFVEDIVPQNKMINRLIILNDFIINTSAKNTLLIPEDSLGEYQPEDFASEYRKVGGVIVYVPSKSGVLPQEIKSQSTNVGINEMIAMQMQLLQEVSGVQGATQGQAPKAGTAASLYAQQAQNSTLNVLDKMDSYASFKQRRDLKIIKLIKQFYKERQYLAVAGRDYSEEAKIWDPEAIKNVEFDVTISSANDTPAYRSLIDDFLMKLLEAGAIDAEMMLENTTMPFASKLLESIKKRKEEMAEGQVPGQIDPTLVQGANAEAQQKADPKTMGMINKGLAA
jgi:hypothetical protein